MITFLKYTAAFLAAVLVSSVLASLFSTQFVIAELQSINVDIPLATRLSMTMKDLGILQVLIPALGASLLVGFLVAGLCVRFIGGHRSVWFTVAGASAVSCLLVLMSWYLQLMPIAGARTSLGLIFQALAGAIGGWLFAKLSSSTGTHS